MDTYYNRQAQNERADKRLGLQEEAFDMQKERHGAEQAKEKATFVLGKIAQGVEPTEDEFGWLKEHPQFWPALDPRTDKSIEVAQSVIDPESPMGPNDPEAIEAMNQLWSHRINRGEGGRKRIAGLYPGQEQGTVALDLEIEKEDGTKYNAPMTKNRGVEGDDEVLQTPVEALVNQVQGYRMLRNAFRTAEAQATATKVLSALTGKTPDRSEAYTKRQEMLGLGVDPEEATRNAYGLKEADKRYGDPFEHPQLGWVQPGPDGQLKQLDAAEGEGEWRRLNDGTLYNQRTGETRQAGEGAPNDGTGGLDPSVMSQIQQTTRNFHGSFNPDGSFLGIPEGAREKYTLAMQRAQELIGKGMPVFEATNLANLSVGDPLTKDEARRLAEQEAEQEVQGWFKGEERGQYVKRRTQELLDESQSAQRRYEQMVGGGQAETSGELTPEKMERAKEIKARFQSGEIDRETARAELRSLGMK
jgi:hypothetical protein